VPSVLHLLEQCKGRCRHTQILTMRTLIAVRTFTQCHVIMYANRMHIGYGGRQAIPMPVNSSGPAAGGGDAIYSMSAPDTYQNPYASMTAIQPLPTPTWNSTGGFPNANAAPGSPSGYGTTSSPF
jgi:hypothetical protein